MTVTRANVEATKSFIRVRLGNSYVYGGALSPTAVRQGTDCSEVWQTALEMTLGRYKPGRQAEGATTESYRPKTMGGPIPIGGVGPFGTIVVARPGDIPADAVAKIAFHHGPGGGRSSHMWGELDGMRIESRGGGVGLITQPRAMALNDPYANAWAYLPGPIAEDGTLPAPEVVILGIRFENAGERVRQLQVALNSRGARLDPDGEFGPLTEEAVRVFQRGNGLEVDGIAGPVTLGALGLRFGTTTPVTTPADTVALLRRAMEPTAQPNARLAELLPHFAEAMRAADITNLRRAAAWCSQIGHESAGLKYMAEIQTSGPDWSWDRTRYRGRGPIQLTWQSNYRRFGQWCQQRGYTSDPELFVNQPELVEQPRWGFLAASWYWLNAGPRPGKINAYADAGDILAVSRCVNGWIEGQDPIGWADRRTRYLNCMNIGDQLLALNSTATQDPWEELMATKVKSLSIYATPGEGPIEVATMIAALDAHGPHEPWVEDQARKGDVDSIRRVARTAAGLGEYRHPGAIKQASAVLVELYATIPDAVTAALGKANS